MADSREQSPKSDHSKDSENSKSSTTLSTGSEGNIFPSEAQKQYIKRVREELERLNADPELLAKTMHHIIPKSTEGGKEIQGHRAAIIPGPSPEKRSDDPGNKSNDVQYEIGKDGEPCLTKQSLAAIRAAADPTNPAKIKILQDSLPSYRIAARQIMQAWGLRHGKFSKLTLPQRSSRPTTPIGSRPGTPKTPETPGTPRGRNRSPHRH